MNKYLLWLDKEKVKKSCGRCWSGTHTVWLTGDLWKVMCTKRELWNKDEKTVLKEFKSVQGWMYVSWFCNVRITGLTEYNMFYLFLEQLSLGIIWYFTFYFIVSKNVFEI